MADHSTLQVRWSANFIRVPISLIPRLSFPSVPSSLLGTIGIGDTYRRKERGQALRRQQLQSFTVIATYSALQATMTRTRAASRPSENRDWRRCSLSQIS